MIVETCSCSRASPPGSHLRGYYLWFGGCAGVVPLTLWIPAFAGMTRVRGPYGLRCPSGLLWFRRSQQYLSASEPYSYNGLRNRVLAALRPSPFIGTEDVFQWLVAGHRRRVVCWRPLLPRPLPYFIQLFLLRLKRLCTRPSRRGDSSCLRRPFDASWLQLYNRCCTNVKCLNRDCKDLKDGRNDGVLGVYEPPAFASLRVPLLLTQKGEGGLPALLSYLTLTPGSGPGQALVLSHQGRGDSTLDRSNRRQMPPLVQWTFSHIAGDLPRVSLRH